MKLNSSIDGKYIPARRFIGNKGTTIEMQVVANQIEGFAYWDTTLHKVMSWNGTEWVSGVEGALVPKGTIDATLANDGSEDTESHKRNLPTANVRVGDTWFVATNGSYVVNGNSVVLHASDFLFCTAQTGGVPTNWELVSTGDMKYIFDIEYSAQSPTLTTWTTANPLCTNYIGWTLYKENTSGTVTTDEAEGCVVTTSYDSSDSSYSLTVHFDRQLEEGEHYKLVCFSV